MRPNQDISMKSFQDKIDATTDGVGDKVLIVITDDEWDMYNLPLAEEVSPAGDFSDDEKKRRIIKFAKTKFTHIVPIIVPKPTDGMNTTPRTEEAQGFGLKMICFLSNLSKPNLTSI